MQKKIFTVSEMNRYIKRVLQQDIQLNSMIVRGEISNFTQHSSGHLYFSLKDKTSAVKCVMFRNHAQKLQFQPAHGMQVLIGGYVAVYERDGIYQLYVEQMMPAGAGALHVAYEQLKEKLEQEGLFATAKKRPLPFFPKRVGIVTSPTGAAIRDLVSIIHRRNPATDISIVPAIVQGSEGAASICNALEILYQENIDVIIVGRGGGSLEELWCFNEEAVVRKIAESPVPIVSAVGHETDVTLSDFAADVRAATPSMAAELVVPVQEQLREKLKLQENTLLQCYTSYLQQKRIRLDHLIQHRVMQKPELFLQVQQQRLDEKTKQLEQLYSAQLWKKQQQLAKSAAELNALNPLQVLSRGYALCQDDMGNLVHSKDAVLIGDAITVVLEDGELYGSVTGKGDHAWNL